MQQGKRILLFRAASATFLALICLAIWPSITLAQSGNQPQSQCANPGFPWPWAVGDAIGAAMCRAISQAGAAAALAAKTHGDPGQREAMTRECVARLRKQPIFDAEPEDRLRGECAKLGVLMTFLILMGSPAVSADRTTLIDACVTQAKNDPEYRPGQIDQTRVKCENEATRIQSTPNFAASIMQVLITAIGQSKSSNIDPRNQETLKALLAPRP